MEIIASDYKDVYNNLPIGSFRKVPHLNCSSSNSLRIEHTVDGYKMYCFKCNEYAFLSLFNSPAEKLRRKRILEAQTKIQAAQDYSLPADFSQSIPPKGLAWLGRGGWTQELITRYKIGYSADLNRVILPVVYESIHRGYTARAVERWQRPKYLEVCQHGVMWESSGAKGNNVVVLTEDILSAGRCGEHFKAYSVLGTSLSTNLLTKLSTYRKVVLWLDKDKGGTEGLKKMASRLRLFSDVKVIQTEKDPKHLTDQEIKERLNESVQV